MEKLDTFQNRIKKEKDPQIKKDLVLALKISKEVKKHKGRALVVGGFVRDEILTKWGKAKPSKDIDLEVYGLSDKILKKIIAKFGKVNLVGESFSVYKLGTLDISLPRKDSKIGKGHRGFKIIYDPKMTFKEAARRRDFTINALAQDPLTGEVLDEHGGLIDLKNGLIKAVDFKLFGDDPLRVLRAVQLAGRFNFKIERNTLLLCKKLDLTELSWERISEEFRKLLILSKKPSLGLNYAKEIGIIKALTPELHAFIGLPQYKKWHPEGEVWIHNNMVIDEAAKIREREKLTGDQAEQLMWAAVVHDLGKAVTTKVDEQKRIVSTGHTEAGVPIAKKFLVRLKVKNKLIDKILPLVREHLFPSLVARACTDAAIRRLAKRLAPATIEDLLLLTEADHRGRALPWDGFPGGKILAAKAEVLHLQERAPKPIFMGRHLIKFGYRPKGQERLFGEVIKLVNEEELDGKIKNLAMAKRRAWEIIKQKGLKK